MRLGLLARRAQLVRPGLVTLANCWVPAQPDAPATLNARLVATMHSAPHRRSKFRPYAPGAQLASRAPALLVLPPAWEPLPLLRAVLPAKWRPQPQPVDPDGSQWFGLSSAHLQPRRFRAPPAEQLAT